MNNYKPSTAKVTTGYTRGTTQRQKGVWRSTGTASVLKVHIRHTSVLLMDIRMCMLQTRQANLPPTLPSDMNRRKGKGFFSTARQHTAERIPGEQTYQVAVHWALLQPQGLMQGCLPPVHLELLLHLYARQDTSEIDDR